jgi:zinc protease
MPHEAERAEIDGIPVFWAPAPGAFRAALMFRVGMADETVPTRGITHLVEHLALFASSSRPFEANGFVDAERCVFHAVGERDDVLGWLTRCAAALADLPLDRLATERRILQAEARGGAGPPVQSRLLTMRLGAQSFGIANTDEFGLRWLDADEVAGWARARFGRGNAALWMTAQPPDSLELPLLDGPRWPPPPVEPLAEPSRRRYVADGTGGVAVAGLGERSTALNAASAITADRLYQRLRIDLGLVYDPYVSYEALGAAVAQVTVGSGCPDDRAERVAGEVWRVVAEIAEGGATEEELAAHHRRVMQSDAEPDALFAVLDYAAGQHLLGEPAYSRAELAAEVAELSPDAIAGAVAAAFERALLLVPAGRNGIDGFALLERPWPEPVAGTTYSYLPGMGDATLNVGGTGLSVFVRDTEPMTMLWDEIVLVERAPLDTYLFNARDGSWIELCFAAVDGGGRALETVLARLPAGVVVPAGNLEATDALSALADRLPQALAVRAELAALPRKLGDDEMPEAVLDYRHADDERGLLALTSERLIRWHLSGEEGDGEEIPRSAIKDAEVRRRLLRPPRLVVRADRELEVVLDDAELAHEFAARLSGRFRR